MLHFRGRLLGILFLFSLITFLPAGETAEYESLTLGVARLSGNNLSPEYEYLVESLSREIFDIVSVCTTHRLTLSEAESIFQKAKDEEEIALRSEIRTLRGERDNLLFSTADTSDKYEELTLSITGKESVLAELWVGENDFEDVTLPLTLSPMNTTGELLPAIAGSVELSRDEELDFLVWGRLEEVEGLLFLSYEIYSFIQDSALFSRNEVYLPEEADSFINDYRKELWNLLLGDDWCSLAVTVPEPQTAMIYLDGEEGRLNRIETGFIKPGKHDILISAYGWESLEEEIFLSPDEELALSFSLVPLGLSRFPVRSLPQGADVFIGSRWMGTTPLFLELPGGFSRILLRKKGYTDYAYYLNDDTTDKLNIQLHGEEFQQSSYNDTKRDSFYHSLGLFFASIPVTAVLYSSSLVNSRAYNLEVNSYGGTEEAERLYTLSELSHHGYIGGLCLNVTLFVNVILDAVEYVRAAGYNFKE